MDVLHAYVSVGVIFAPYNFQRLPLIILVPSDLSRMDTSCKWHRKRSCTHPFAHAGQAQAQSQPTPLASAQPWQQPHNHPAAQFLLDSSIPHVAHQLTSMQHPLVRKWPCLSPCIYANSNTLQPCNACEKVAEVSPTNRISQVFQSKKFNEKVSQGFFWSHFVMYTILSAPVSVSMLTQYALCILLSAP